MSTTTHGAQLSPTPLTIATAMEFMVPTKRKVYAPDADNQKIPEPVLVAIDIHDIAFSADKGCHDSMFKEPHLEETPNGENESRASA